MTDSATPATAPDAMASVDDRHAYVMSVLNKPKPEAEKPEVATPEAETSEAADDTSKETVETTEEGQTESEASNEEEAEPEGSQEKTSLVKVKVDGEWREVTLDEALKGYSRTEHFKRDTARLADDRRSFEKEVADHRAKATQTSGDYLSIVSQASEDSLLLANAENVDWVKLAEVDSAKHTLLKAKVEAAAERVQKATQERGQQRNAYLAEQFEEAKKHIPEYADEKTRPKFVSELASYMSSVGYAPQEIQNLGDSRAMRVASDAMKYRGLLAKQEAAKKQLLEKKERAAEVINPNRRIQSNGASEGKRAMKAKIASTSDLREKSRLVTEFNSKYPEG